MFVKRLNVEIGVVQRRKTSSIFDKSVDDKLQFLKNQK